MTDEPTPRPPHPRNPTWPIREVIEAFAREHYGDPDASPDTWDIRDMLFIMLVEVGDVYLSEIERTQPVPDLDDPSSFESGLLAGGTIETVLYGLQDHLEDRQNGEIERVP
jgi:hypothetical protein